MQYDFDFSPAEPGYNQLVIGPANRVAIDRLEAGAAWPSAALCLLGPARSGRSAMARAWTASHGGQIWLADAFNSADLATLDRIAAGTLAIDDADAGLDDDRLLHVLNRARELGGRILLTAAVPPVSWTASQPDLVSRLRALTVVTIDPPTEDMMRDLIETVCHRRHLGLPDEVWTYLERRLPRDYAAIEALAEGICFEVSGTGRSLTVPVARQVLGDTDGVDDDGEGEDEDEDE